MQPPATGNSWLGLTDQVLPIAAAYEWCVLPACGAVVLFSGTVRDHAVDKAGTMRDDVQYLTYEAYEQQVVPSFTQIEAELRQRRTTATRDLRKAADAAEARVQSLEERLDALRAQQADPAHYANPQAVREVAQQVAAVEAELAQAYEKWEASTGALEAAEAAFTG